MSYQILDQILEDWAKKHSLHLYTTYKDEEVRSIDIVSPSGKHFQLWLDDPGSNERTVIHVWDYRKRRSDFDADLSNLKTQLERAYSEIKSWF